MAPEAVRCPTCSLYDAGRCRAHPPQVFLDRGARMPEDYNSQWPQVGPDDWCGEWTDKALPLTQPIQ